MNWRAVTDFVIILISALVAFIPTSMMLFKDHGPEKMVMGEKTMVGYSLYSVSLQKRAILGNAGALLLLFISVSSNRLLMKLQIWLATVAGIGLIWAGYRYLKFHIAGLMARIRSKEGEVIDETCGQYYLFQAEVAEVDDDRLFVTNTTIKMETSWFPFCYPSLSSEKPIDLFLDKKPCESGSTIAKGDKISFLATVNMDAYENRKTGQSRLDFYLQQHHKLEVISSFEQSDMTKEQLMRIWYWTEFTICRECPFKVACQKRKNPCVVLISNGCWNRTLLETQYPQLIESTLADIKSLDQGDGYLGVILHWGSKRTAKRLGFKEAGAIIYYAPHDSKIRVGCQICSIDGKQIDSIKSLHEVLKTHKAGEVVSIVTRFPDKQQLQQEITLVDRDHLAHLIFTRMPFLGEKGYAWYFT